MHRFRVGRHAQLACLQLQAPAALAGLADSDRVVEDAVAPVRAAVEQLVEIGSVLPLAEVEKLAETAIAMHKRAPGTAATEEMKQKADVESRRLLNHRIALLNASDAVMTRCIRHGNSPRLCQVAFADIVRAAVARLGPGQPRDQPARQDLIHHLVERREQ